MEWIVPQLSEQQFEIEADIVIINVQSYPTVGGNWTVYFDTVGTADLTITGIDGTTFGETLPDDLEFLEINDGTQTLTPTIQGNSIFYPNYSSTEIGFEISRVLTPGEHHLMFQFGNDIQYANNDAFYEFTFDVDGDFDELAWTFESENGPDGLNPPNTLRSWSHDTDDTASNTIGPTSDQEGLGEGYVYTEATFPAAASDEFYMTFDTPLDASTESWIIEFYTNQRGTNNDATVKVQVNENGGGWTDVVGSEFGGPSDPDKIGSSGIDKWVKRTVDLDGVILK